MTTVVTTFGTCKREFEPAPADKAATHLHAHWHLFGALVEALLARKTLDTAAIADLWEGHLAAYLPR